MQDLHDMSADHTADPPILKIVPPPGKMEADVQQEPITFRCICQQLDATCDYSLGETPLQCYVCSTEVNSRSLPWSFDKLKFPSRHSTHSIRRTLTAALETFRIVLNRQFTTDDLHQINRILRWGLSSGKSSSYTHYSKGADQLKFSSIPTDFRRAAISIVMGLPSFRDLKLFYLHNNFIVLPA